MFLVYQDNGPEGMGAFAICATRERADDINQIVTATSHGSPLTIVEVEENTMYSGLYDLTKEN